MTGNIQILNFQRVSHNICPIEARTEDGDCSTETLSEKQGLRPPTRYEQRQHVKVATDFYPRFQQEEEETDLLQGTHHRKDSCHV